MQWVPPTCIPGLPQKGLDNLCVCVMEAEAVSMQWTGGDYVSGEEASQLMCVWGLGGGLLQGLRAWSMCSKPPPQGCLTNPLTQCHKRKTISFFFHFFFQGSAKAKTSNQQGQGEMCAKHHKQNKSTTQMDAAVKASREEGIH